MADKTDVSELAPETADSEDVTRARLAALRDQLLTVAENHVSMHDLDQMAAVAVMTTAAAQANHAIRMHSIEQLEKSKQAEVTEYFNNFMKAIQAMEEANMERFVQQKRWVEQEMRARGMEPQKDAKVLSLVPNDGAPSPDAAG